MPTHGMRDFRVRCVQSDDNVSGNIWPAGPFIVVHPAFIPMLEMSVLYLSDPGEPRHSTIVAEYFVINLIDLTRFAAAHLDRPRRLG